MNNCNNTDMFAVRSMFTESSMITVFIAMMFSIILGGYCLRIFERPYSEYSGQDMASIWNAMWCIVLTMTTVGFGDYYPITHPGRIVAFIVATWGVFVVSLQVVTLSNMLVFKDGEYKSYLILSRLVLKDKLRERAAMFVTSAMKYFIMKGRSKCS